jgi:hypothetical protein
MSFEKVEKKYVRGEAVYSARTRMEERGERRKSKSPRQAAYFFELWGDDNVTLLKQEGTIWAMAGIDDEVLWARRLGSISVKPIAGSPNQNNECHD